MKKEARIITNYRFGEECYDIEIKNVDGTWDLCGGYVLKDELVHNGIIDKIMSLIIQGYTIYDER